MSREAERNDFKQKMLSSFLDTCVVIIIKGNSEFIYLFVLVFFSTLVLHKQYSHQYSKKLFIWS